jgi:prepilin peptidase CpaA
LNTQAITLCETVTVGAATIAAIIDARSGRIPNWLTFPVTLLGFAVHASLGASAALMLSALGFALGVVVPGLLYWASNGRAIGGGDVKLFAALGSLLGPIAVIQVEFSAFAVVAIFALVRLAYRGQALRVLWNAASLLVNPLLPRRWRRVVAPEAMTEMRMGPAIATAVIASVVVSHVPQVLPWTV